jgi:hypothetical protein
MESTKFSLNKADLIAIGKGLLITLAGAALTYLTQAIANTNFGASTPLVVAVFALIINVVRKYIAGK